MAEETVIVKGFKGFDKDLKCRDKQYEVDKTYEEDEASLCQSGLHFCTAPLDVFRYYRPGLSSRYCEVQAENPSDETSEDSKCVTKKLHIGGEINVAGLVKAHVAYTTERVQKAKELEINANESSGTDSSSAAHGTDSSSAAHGDGSSSAAHGDGSSSRIFEGEDSVAIAHGYSCKAAASLGSWIVLTECDEDRHILVMKCGKIDGETLKSDTFYTLKDGEFVEIE